MQARTGSFAARVGLLFAAFLVLLSFAWRFLGSHFSADQHVYYVTLPDASGLMPGSNVLLSGVPIGTIAQVGLDSANQAKLTVRTDKEHPIPAGSQAVVPSSLVGFGQAALEIIPPAGAAAPLSDGTVLAGTKQSPLHSILPNSQETVANLNKTLVAFQKILNDRRLTDGLTGVMQNGQQTLKQMSLLMARTDQLMGANQASITRAIGQASLAMADLHKGTGLMVHLLQKGQFQDQTMALLKSLTATSDRANHLVGDLQSFANDQELRKNLNATMANTAKLTAEGQKIGDSVKSLTDTGKDAAQHLITLTNHASETADQASKLLVKLQSLVDKVDHKVDKIGGVPKIGPVKTEMDVMRDNRPNYNRTDFNVSVPFGKDVLHAGVYDAFQSNRLNLQLGTFLKPNLEVRYGAYAGRLGLGVNYQIAPRLSLVNDIYGLNDPLDSLRAKYEFGHGFIGWLGVDQLFEKNRLTLGIGYQK